MHSGASLDKHRGDTLPAEDAKRCLQINPSLAIQGQTQDPGPCLDQCLLAVKRGRQATAHPGGRRGVLTENPGGDRQTQVGIENDPQRVPCPLQPGQPGGQTRVVDQNRLHADKDRIHPVAYPMGIPTGLRTGDRPGLTGTEGYPAIETEAGLHDDPRQAGGTVLEEGAVQLPALRFEHTAAHLDPSAAQVV